MSSTHYIGYLVIVAGVANFSNNLIQVRHHR